MVESSENSRRAAPSAEAEDGIIQARVTRSLLRDKKTLSLKELRAKFAEFQSIQLNTGSKTLLNSSMARSSGSSTCSSGSVS